VEDVGAAAPAGVVVAAPVEHAAGEEDAAAAPERDGHLRAGAGAVDLDVDLALRRVDRRLVRVDGIVLAARDDVETTMLQLCVIHGHPRGDGIAHPIQVAQVDAARHRPRAFVRAQAPGGSVGVL
jgi:hypothetical protein